MRVGENVIGQAPFKSLTEVGYSPEKSVGYLFSHGKQNDCYLFRRICRQEKMYHVTVFARKTKVLCHKQIKVKAKFQVGLSTCYEE